MSEPLTQPAALVWRLPIIRHVHWAWNLWRVNCWYGTWLSFGYYENNDFDRRCLDQIWKGIV